MLSCQFSAEMAKDLKCETYQSGSA